MPEEATTQVWITVFSWRVKGCFNMPELCKTLVHVLTKKYPNSPAETLREGIIPVVRLSFITMKVNITDSNKLTANALFVSWFLHEGTSIFSNILSTDNSSSPSPSPCFIFPFFFSSNPNFASSLFSSLWFSILSLSLLIWIWILDANQGVEWIIVLHINIHVNVTQLIFERDLSFWTSQNRGYHTWYENWICPLSIARILSLFFVWF